MRKQQRASRLHNCSRLVLVLGTFGAGKLLLPFQMFFIELIDLLESRAHLVDRLTKIGGVVSLIVGVGEDQPVTIPLCFRLHPSCR